MPANDDALRLKFNELADSSRGSLVFRVMTSRELSEKLGLELSRSPNPLYYFELAKPGEPSFRSVAYTLALDGRGRAATRAEALGRSIAATQGQLFQSNPFLLIYDYTDERFLAVSAAKLFALLRRRQRSAPLPIQTHPRSRLHRALRDRPSQCTQRCLRPTCGTVR
jgi:hypothetical protein